MLVALLCNEFCCMCLYMNVAGLLPNYVDKNYESLGSLDVGILMSAFPVGFLVTAPIIGSLMEKIGRRNALYIGTLTIVFATLLFGLAGYATNAYLYFYISE